VRLIRMRRGSRAEWLFVRIGGALIYALLRLIGWTTRKRYVNGDELLERFARGQPVILAFWHGRMVMMPFAYRGRGACIMNSQHRDGEIISRAIKPFGIDVVRGSSTRGWVGGMKGLLEAYQRGCDLVVVPDGPRGPRYRAKSGVVQLARSTGAPIYPVSYGVTRALSLKSWDELRIPLPFSRVTYVVEAPIEVSAKVTVEEMEALRLRLEESLNRAMVHADHASGIALTTPSEYKRDGVGEPSPADEQSRGETQEIKGDRAMGRFIAGVLVCALIAGGAASPAWAAGKKKSSTKSASKESSDTADTTSSQDDAARAEDLSHKFETFCSTWMDKLREREKYNLAHIQWQPDAGGVVGEYVGYETDQPEHTVSHTEKKSVPIGKLIYREVKLKLSGKSEAEALANKPEIVERTEVTELFRYDHGVWVY